MVVAKKFKHRLEKLLPTQFCYKYQWLPSGGDTGVYPCNVAGINAKIRRFSPWRKQKNPPFCGGFF